MSVAAFSIPQPAVARPAPVVTWLVGDLRTGRVTATLPVRPGATWAVVHNVPGRLTVTLPLADDLAAAVNPLVTAAPARCFLAADYDGVILEAGPIWGHDYDDTTGDLAIGAAGMWSLLDHRFVLPVLADLTTAPAAETTVQRATLAAIARALVEQAMTHTGGDLPIVLPADEPGTAHTRTYLGSDLAKVGEKLKDLTQVEDGPDLALRPRYVDGDRTRIEWALVAGDPFLVQAGPDWVWDATVPESGITGISVATDATSMATRAWVTGNGAGQDQKVGVVDNTELVDLGYPLLEVDEDRTTTTVQATVDAHARDLSARAARPVQTWTITVRADQAPLLGTYAVGDWASVVVPKSHRYLPGGQYRTRIVGIASSGDAEVKLSLAPTLAVI